MATSQTGIQGSDRYTRLIQAHYYTRIMPLYKDHAEEVGLVNTPQSPWSGRNLHEVQEEVHEEVHEEVPCI